MLTSLQYIHILTITAAFLAILSSIQYFRYRTPATGWAGWFMIFMAAELITFSFQLVGGPFDSIHYSYFMQCGFFLLMSVCWLFFIAAIADMPAKMNWRLVITILGVSTLVVLLLPDEMQYPGAAFVPGVTSAISFLRAGQVLGLPGRFVLSLIYTEGVACLYLLYRLSKNADKSKQVFAMPMLIGTGFVYALATLERFGVDPFLPLHISQIGLVFASIVIFIFAVVWRFGGFLPISRESVFDSLRDGVLILNYEDRIMDLNLSALKMFGMTRNEIVKKPLRAVWPKGAEMITMNPDKALIDDESVFTIDGQEYTFSVNINRTLGLNRSLLGSVIVMRNVTSLDRMEVALHERNRELQRSNTFLEALSEVNTKLHDATDLSAMNVILGEELRKLGLVCFLMQFDPVAGVLELTYFSGWVKGLERVERIIGRSPIGLKLDRRQFYRLYEIFDDKEVSFSSYSRNVLAEVPGKIPVAILEKAIHTVGISMDTSTLVLPLNSREQKLGLMGVWGEDLREGDIPPFQIFANQVASVMDRAIQYDREIQRSAELKRVNSLTMALSKVASVVSTTSNSKIVLDTLGKELKKVGLDCAVVSISTENETAYLNYLSFKLGLIRQIEKLTGLKLEGFAIPRKYWPGGKILEEQRPAWYENPKQIFRRMFPILPDRIIYPALNLLDISDDQKVCFLPLMHEMDTIGAMAIWGPALKADDNLILSVFGNQVASIIHNVASLEKQVQRTDDLTRANAMILALSKVAVELDTLSNLDQVYAALGEELQTVGISCMVGILDDEKENLVIEHVKLLPGIIQFSDRLGVIWPEKPRIPNTLWPTDSAVVNGVPFWDEDPVGSARRMFHYVPRVVFEHAFQISGMEKDGQICYIPMINRENIFGVLAVWGKGLKKEDVPALTVFANQVASAINNIRLYDQAQKEIEDRRQAESRIRVALEDKEVLLKEVHHRVKNNLQVITSLLNLQLAQTEDEMTRDILRESQNRVLSMALIHEKLYQSSDLAQVDFNAYLYSLVTSLRQTYRVNAEKVTIAVQSEDIALSIDTAIPCGLIVNELVSNSLKYAFGQGAAGKIDVFCSKKSKERYKLTVQDNGVGLPEGFEAGAGSTLGLKLVNSLVRQIDGKLHIENHNGTRFEIEFSEVEE